VSGHIDKAEYRIDRMLTQLGQPGKLKNLAGIIFGQCTDCKDNDGGNYGGFTLTDILQQHLGPLGVPAFQGAFIGHMPDQFTIPLGVQAQLTQTQAQARSSCWSRPPLESQAFAPWRVQRDLIGVNPFLGVKKLRETGPSQIKKQTRKKNIQRP
jgi:hypothetical protein